MGITSSVHNMLNSKNYKTNINMEPNKTRFKNLSHITFYPSKKRDDFQLLHRKGEKKEHFSILRGSYRSRHACYDQDVYGYTDRLFYDDDDFWTKEELLTERYLCTPQESFDVEGYIWTPYEVVVHFLDGTKKTFQFWNRQEAEDFYNSYSDLLPHEI